jgi:hypothetical protein
MQNKDYYKQKDFLSTQGLVYRKKNNPHFSSRLRNFILLSITIFAFTIGSFGAGFLWGTNLQNRAPHQNVAEQIILVRKNEDRVIRRPAPQPIQPTQNGRQQPLDQKPFFTVQLITHTSERLAQENMRKLKGKGLAPFMIRDGRHFVIHAGRYDNIRIARNRLPFYRRFYADSFVRRMQ